MPRGVKGCKNDFLWKIVLYTYYSMTKNISDTDLHTGKNVYNYDLFECP